MNVCKTEVWNFECQCSRFSLVDGMKFNFLKIYFDLNLFYSICSTQFVLLIVLHTVLQSVLFFFNFKRILCQLNSIKTVRYKMFYKMLQKKQTNVLTIHKMFSLFIVSRSENFNYHFFKFHFFLFSTFSTSHSFSF